MTANHRDANTGMARALVDEWARHGVTTAALAPGSRSAPLALALAADHRIDLQVFLDERSAAFFAVGAAKASGRPALVLSTSGTAAANFHPAVLEADHGRAPLIVCTADRPPELRDTGAGQAVDQLKLYGAAVRWFADLGVPDDTPAAAGTWRSVAARAVAEARGRPAGPVHLNLAFREPLVPVEGMSPAPAPGRPEGHPWTRWSVRAPAPHADDVAALADAVAAAPRGLVVVGWGGDVDPAAVERLSATARWPVLADTISGARTGPHAISTYDALLRSPAFAEAMAPDLVLQVGASLTGKVATGWLAERANRRIVVDPNRLWSDPHRRMTERIEADSTLLLDSVSDRLAGASSGERRSTWLSGWLTAEAAARATIDDLVDGWDEPFEGRIARDLVDALPDGATLVAGSSMPVRDLEGFARPRHGLRLVSNRGASGIDGFTSTALGAAAVADGPVVALAGDLTLLHDAGGLWHAADRGVETVIVVVDNDGGGVFSFLPQAGLDEHFETLFGTPHGLDLCEWAAAHGVPAQRVSVAADLGPSVIDAVKAGGVRVLVVPSERSTNVARHRQVWDAVAEAVGSVRSPS